jgi:DNA polymerase eta
LGRCRHNDPQGIHIAIELATLLMGAAQVSLDYYRRESAKVHAALKENLPGAEIGSRRIVSTSPALAFMFPIEKASIDEAFIDLTRPCRARLLDRYPYLATVPPNSPKGSDSPLPQPPQIRWDGPGSLVPVNDVPAMDGIADVHAASEDDVMMTWHDVVLSIAAEMMAIARTEVHSQLGYTTSAVRPPTGVPLTLIG